MRLSDGDQHLGVVVPHGPGTPRWQLGECLNAVTAACSPTVREAEGLDPAFPLQISMVSSSAEYSWPVRAREDLTPVTLYQVGGVGWSFAENVNRGIRFCQELGCQAVLILNADAHVLPGSLEIWMEYLRSVEDLAIVGCVSNVIGGPAMIPDWQGTAEQLRAAVDHESWLWRPEEEIHNPEYLTLERVASWTAAHRRVEHAMKLEDVGDVKMVAAMVPIWAIERIGDLDTRFHPGNREDVDWSWRARQQGYRTVFAHDVFVHHYGSTSFDGEEHWRKAMRDNRGRFNAKWSHTSRFALSRRQSDLLVPPAEIYNLLEREEPYSADPLLWRAELVLSQRPRQALRDLELYLGKHPRDMKAWWLRTEALVACGRHTEAYWSTVSMEEYFPNARAEIDALQDRVTNGES